MVFVFLVKICLQNLVQKDSNNTILLEYSKDVTVSSMNFGSFVQVCKIDIKDYVQMVFVFLVKIRLQNLVQKDSNNTILLEYSKDVTVSSMNFGNLVQVCKIDIKEYVQMVVVFLVKIRLQNLVQKDSNNTILLEYSKDVTVSSMNFDSFVQVCKIYGLMWSLMTFYDYQSIKLSFF
jgi:hypothetical protein